MSAIYAARRFYVNALVIQAHACSTPIRVGGLPLALDICRSLAKFQPLWIEEPTHPDDIRAHARLAEEIAPVKIAAGEHIPNRGLFKNFRQAGALHCGEADGTGVGGVGRLLTVSLLAKKLGLPPVLHVGYM